MSKNRLCAMLCVNVGDIRTEFNIALREFLSEAEIEAGHRSVIAETGPDVA